MFIIEQNNIIVERSKSMRALYLFGGVIMTVRKVALLTFAGFLLITSGESKPPLVFLSLLIVFVFSIGITAISQSGTYRLTRSRLTGEYKEERTQFGGKSSRTGQMSDFTTLKLTPLKDKDAGCVINLCQRDRPLFRIQLGAYYDNAEARADLQRISAATGILWKTNAQIPATVPHFERQKDYGLFRL